MALEDAQKIQGGSLVKWGAKLYSFLIGQFPFVWSWLYNTKWFIGLTLPYRTWAASFNYEHVLSVINEFKPDIIISTQITASAIIAFLKKEKLYQGLFGIAFSDFHLHRFWLFDQADFYLANIEEQKQEMIELGTAAEKIFVCGMTLKPKIEIDVQSIKNKFGIEEGEKTALISSGSQGTGVDESFIRQLINKKRIRAIVVCGKNKKLFEDLSEKFAGSRAVILGYYSPMEELYAIADIFITKPGGLSVAEAARYNLPIVISHMLPGQEELNYSYLLEKSLIMPEAVNITGAVLEELQTKGFKKLLVQNPEFGNLFNAQTTPAEAVEIALGS